MGLGWARVAVWTVPLAVVLASCGTTVPNAGRIGGGNGDQFSLNNPNGDQFSLNNPSGSPSSSRGPGGFASSLPGSSGLPGAGGAAGIGYSPGAGSNPSRLAPGLTATEMFVGTTYASSNSSLMQQAAAARGVKGQPFDPKPVDKALIDYFNQRGGIRGHKIELVVHTIDPNKQLSQPAEVHEQASCSFFTEDHQVFAAMPGDYGPTYWQCMYDRHVTVIDSEPDVTGDSVWIRQWPNKFMPNGVNDTMAARSYINGLYAQGFFGQGAKIGLLLEGCDYLVRSNDQGIVPALASHGLSIKDKSTVACTTDAQSAGQAEAAAGSTVLKFFTDGITHVIFWNLEGFSTTFLAQASLQHYSPRYGFSSFDYPELSFANNSLISSSQLEKSMGVGWLPNYDVDPSTIPMTASGNRCIAILKEARVYVDSSPDMISNETTECDSWFMLEAAANAAPSLTVSGMITGIGNLGTTQLANLLIDGVATFAPGKPEGGSLYRPFAFIKSCDCFHYSGSSRPLG